jgi:hypothetical protein
MKYIIVKYADHTYPDGKAPITASVFNTYSANSVGVTNELYHSKEEAEIDLRKLQEFNPTVFYGIVEVLTNHS